MREIEDLFAEENLPPSNYAASWQSYADWHRGAARQVGIRPDWRVLDIGCGAGRGAVALAPLCARYRGVDAFAPYVRIANRLLEGIPGDHQAVVGERFEFAGLGTTFDLAVAHSLFPHIAHDQIELCLDNLKPVMAPGGLLLLTFVSHENVAQFGHLYHGSIPMTRSRLVTRGFFAGILSGRGLAFQEDVMAHPTQSVWLVRF